MVSGVLPKGTMVAGYRVDGILGQGGMGVVYEATQLALDRSVALKVLAVHLSGDIEFQTRFKREGQIQAGIDHPHIVTVFDSGQSEHGFFIAMRLVRGPNLKDLIVARQLDAGRTLRILTPVAEALDTAHAAGLIHRDIKPQNILVSGRDHAFLADFGLTKATGDKSMTRTGQFVGTLDYISPEQIRGERGTVQSDVYALAGVMYECLTGIVPFPKESEAAVLYAHMADPPPRVSDHRPELPGQLDEVMARAMAKDSSVRPPSAAEFMLEVNRAFSRRIRAAFTPPGPLEVPEETGIRPAEVEVGTRETPRPSPSETPAGETVPRAPAEGVPAESAPAGEAAPAEPSEAARTAPGALGPTAPGELGPTAPAALGPTAPAAPGEAAPGPGVSEPGVPPPDVTAPGVTAPGAGAPPQVPTGPPAGRVYEPPPARREQPALRQAPVREGVSGGLLVVGAVGLLALLVVGFLLGRSGSDGDGGGDQGRRVAAGSLSVSPPAAWRPAGSAFELPGLQLDDRTALSPGGSASKGVMAVGTTDATGPTLLPAAFVRRLGEPPARDDPVALGDIEAYRYAGVKPRGYDGPMTLYVAPTTEGVATIVCAGPRSAGASFLADCESAATTLRLSRGTAYPLGGDPAYSKRLESTMARLNRARNQQTKALEQAKTARGQASAATRLATAYASAARSLAGTAVSPELARANARVVRAMREGAAGYRQLAAAARGERPGAYSAATRRIKAADTDLRRALAAIDAR